MKAFEEEETIKRIGEIKVHGDSHVLTAYRLH
jgi:hypothetical protein